MQFLQKFILLEKFDEQWLWNCRTPNSSPEIVLLSSINRLIRIILYNTGRKFSDLVLSLFGLGIEITFSYTPAGQKIGYLKHELKISVMNTISLR